MTLRKNWQLIYALTLALVVSRAWAEEKKAAPAKPTTAPKCCTEKSVSGCTRGCADKCSSCNAPKSSKLVTRIHPLAAFFEAMEYVEEMGIPAAVDQQFVRLITNHIKPQSWACLGGEATIDFYSLGKALVVTANPETQEEIAKFLKELLSLTDSASDEEEEAGFPCLPVPFGFMQMVRPLPPCCPPAPMSVPAFAMPRMMAQHAYPCPMPVYPPPAPPAVEENPSRYVPQIVAQQFQPFGFINRFSPSAPVASEPGTAAPEMLPPPRLAVEPGAPVLPCAAVPPASCSTAGCIVRARCESGKARLEMESGCMAWRGSCEYMEWKIAGFDSVKLLAQENQIHIDCHAFRATADSMKYSSRNEWTLEGHVQFSYKHDGVSAQVRGERLVLSLKNGQVEFKLGNAPLVPPAVIQPAGYSGAPN
jgi:hypothetical protein